VNDLEEIARIWERYGVENGIGASDMQSRCGDLVAADGSVVARISYNGGMDVSGRRIY